MSVNVGGELVFKDRNQHLFKFLTVCFLITALASSLCYAEDNVNTLFVPVAFYTPETGGGGGGGVYITYGGTDQENSEVMSRKVRNLVVPFFVYTQKNQSIARLYWDFWPTNRDDLKVATAFGYTNYPDTFFGIGNNTKLSNAENFTEIYSSADIDIDYKIFSKVYFGLLGRIDSSAIKDKEPNGLLASGTVSGHDGGHISGTGAQIRFINTNHIFTPTSGYNLVAKYINYGLLAGAGRQFQIAELRLKRYLPISEKSVFAFEYLAQDAAGNIPFRKLPLLGGQYLLRGFFLGRFRDNSLQAIQSEYRYTVNEKYGFNSFASAGAVGSDIDSTFRKKWHVSAGVGIRYTLIDADKLSLRLDIARNKEETSIYFGAGEAF